MSSKSFCSAINCMDGRVQEPVIRYMKQNFRTDYVDMITLPGPEKVLAAGEDITELARIRECLTLSVGKHGSTMIGIFAHDDCAGNPVSRDIKESQIEKSVALVRSWFPETEIAGFYINEKWEVVPVAL